MDKKTKQTIENIIAIAIIIAVILVGAYIIYAITTDPNWLMLP